MVGEPFLLGQVVREIPLPPPLSNKFLNGFTLISVTTYLDLPMGGKIEPL